MIVINMSHTNRLVWCTVSTMEMASACFSSFSSASARIANCAGAKIVDDSVSHSVMAIGTPTHSWRTSDVCIDTRTMAATHRAEARHRQ